MRFSHSRRIIYSQAKAMQLR